MDTENLFDSQDFYAGQGSGQGSGLPFGHGNQHYDTNQDYSVGHGSAPVEDDSHVEEVSPVKAKKVSKRASKAKKNDNKNDEADGSEDKIREERSIGHDRAKKKPSSSYRSATSSVAGGGLDELVPDKWKSIKSEGWGKKKEQQDSYIQLKNRELDLQDTARREAAELKRKELALQPQTLVLAVKKKRDKDIFFYSS
ncbi:hypothetical protein Tco_0078579 [Tanacetum coccineum]